jgi:hypothetical protein
MGDLRPPPMPRPLAQPRIEALEAWLDARRTQPLDGRAVHELLTHVVDETAAICDLVQSELIAAAPPPQTPAPKQEQWQSRAPANGGA